MKKLLYFCSAIVGVSTLCSALPVCTDGPLASYIALGSSGCAIGDNTLSGFSTLSGISSATAISPGDVSVHPSGGNFDPRLSFVVDQTANANKRYELLFTYQISGMSYVGDSITLTGSSESGDGAVTDLQNLCAGGAFGPDGVTGCTGFAGSLLTLDGVQNQNSISLGPTPFLNVTDDFTLDGGLTGSASGGSVEDRFSAVPEPFTYLLTGLGLALGLGVNVTRGNRRRL